MFREGIDSCMLSLHSLIPYKLYYIICTLMYIIIHSSTVMWLHTHTQQEFL